MASLAGSAPSRASQCGRILAVLAEREIPGRDVVRFFAKVKVDEATGCWLWLAGTDPHGYGRFSVARPRKDRKAHRVLYEWLHGPLPAGLECDHLCRVPACVNPDHLEPVTHAENIRRGYAAKPRKRADQCRNGHRYTPENTAQRAYYERHKDEIAEKKRAYRERSATGRLTLLCAECGEHLARRTPDGLCGFCRMGIPAEPVEAVA